MEAKDTGWKDTVMSSSEIDTRLCNYSIHFDEGDMWEIQKMVILQAKISFKAGRQELIV